MKKISRHGVTINHNNVLVSFADMTLKLEKVGSTILSFKFHIHPLHQMTRKSFNTQILIGDSPALMSESG